ncbi:hypothetical protein GALL_411650 [mine drainage metagenome]|uniref:Uncharacterized protein n=1 Tax=mine drainage metagenome TaxID=410659 RepID=A0A1J5QAZ4_9ZZZZ
MLNLHAGVHLDEIELAVLVEKLESARAPIVDFLAGVGAARADALDQPARNSGSWGFFEDFLMPALHGAVALSQPDRVAKRIGQHLDFDVPRIEEEFLHVHRRIAESRSGFAAGHADGVEQRGFGMHHAHAASAAAARGLDDDGIADGAGDAGDFARVFGQFALGAGHAGHAGTDHGLLGADLVAHQTDGLGPRADEGEAGLFDPFGEVGVFGEKAVAGVDGFGIRHLGGGNDGRHVQVALRRGRRADAHRLVGQPDVFGFAVRLGIDHHGLDAEFATGALHPEGDFPAVGDENFFEHARRPFWGRRRPGAEAARRGRG